MTNLPTLTPAQIDEIEALLAEGSLDAEAMQIIRGAAPALLQAARREEKMREFVEGLLEQSTDYWLNESEARGEMRELGIPDDADAAISVTMGNLRAVLKDAPS